MENRILPSVQLISKLTKHTHFFTLFAKNTAAVFFANGKNGSTLTYYRFILYLGLLVQICWTTWVRQSLSLTDLPSWANTGTLISNIINFVMVVGVKIGGMWGWGGEF